MNRFKYLFEDYNDNLLSEFIPLIYKFCMGENYFQKMFDKYKRNINSGNIDSQIIIRTWDLEYPIFYDKDKILKNLMFACDNLKIMNSFLSSGTKKPKPKENNLIGRPGARKNSQQLFGRKSTLKKVDRKKSNAKLNMKNSLDKESPTFISEDNSEFESASMSPPQKSRISIYIKKKISDDK